MKRLIILLGIVIAALVTGSAALACEINFTIISKEGESVEVRPNKPVTLETGETYTMEVEFVQDHRNCIVPAEDTVYLLEEEKWKTGKEHLPLLLLSQSEWTEVSSGTWEQNLVFIAQESQKTALEVIRDCPKGGYDETLEFKIK
ncbi:MAG: hypothetical protein JXQ30_07955 [Spirochaetes bacterium]|nr:hypothetical protein [Spirochaetota bacterium]